MLSAEFCLSVIKEANQKGPEQSGSSADQGRGSEGAGGSPIQCGITPGSSQTACREPQRPPPLAGSSPGRPSGALHFGCSLGSGPEHGGLEKWQGWGQGGKGRSGEEWRERGRAGGVEQRSRRDWPHRALPHKATPPCCALGRHHQSIMELYLLSACWASSTDGSRPLLHDQKGHARPRS